MRNFTIYLALSLCLLASKLVAQNQDPKVESTTQTFEAKVKAIGDKIEKITAEEKAFLKIEVEKVNLLVEKGTITQQQADDKKKALANASATSIESRIAAAQEELKELVQAKVDGKLAEYSKNHEFSLKWKSNKDTIQKSEKRTTSQFVFALGLNNVATSGKVAGSDFRYWGSHFYEWGVTYNTRLLKNDNLLHLKYGFSVMYNNLRPTDNRAFVKNGDQTNLEVSAIHLDDSRFKNVYLVAPLHLEFDFSKNKTREGKAFFQSHESVRIGLGGYAGFRLKSKQFQLFDDGNGHDVTVKEKGDFNVNNFIYGVSGYIGYKQTSLYVKYDLNPVFENNTVKQNNISLGLRFDLN